MAHYSVIPIDWMFVKGDGFLSFSKNLGRNIDKNISKNLSSTYIVKNILIRQSYLLKMDLKLLQKTAEATGNLIENKIADKITKVSKTSPQNTSKTNEEEIFRERHISPEQRHKIIDNLRLRIN